MVRATAIVKAAHLIFAEQNRRAHDDERDDPNTRAAKAELQRHIAELAACLRALAIPPEQVVVLAKEMAEEAVERTGPSPSLAIGPFLRELRDDIVRWVIDGYYDAPLVQQLAPRRPSVAGA